MHEMSLAESVLQIIEEQAARHAFARVKTIRLEIGRLSGVEVKAMRFAMDAIARGTLADGARLEIIETAGQGLCPNCLLTVPMEARFDSCSHCGSYGLQPTAGTAMRVRELDVE